MSKSTELLLAKRKAEAQIAVILVNLENETGLRVDCINKISTDAFSDISSVAGVVIDLKL